MAIDLPGADPHAGLAEYRDLIVAAARTAGEPVVLVAQSLGGFSAPLACEQVLVERLVLVNAMIPEPGETAGEWWDAVGWRAAAQASAERDGRPAPDVRDLETLFFADLPSELVEIMRADPDAAAEGPTVFTQAWPLADWPDLATTVLSGREDRLFPIDLQRRVARKRLGLDVQELPGGHLLALSQPSALAEHLTTHAQPDDPTPGDRVWR
jgi:pimeloyl-ACP methyl ester carboxylesterase